MPICADEKEGSTRGSSTPIRTATHKADGRYDPIPLPRPTLIAISQELTADKSSSFETSSEPPPRTYRPGRKLLSRLALVTTVTELNAIAAPAIMGESRTPKNG